MKEYKGIPYVIHYYDQVQHFNAYIRIPEGHPWEKFIDKVELIFGKEIHNGYYDIPLEVHGGLTFSHRIGSDYAIWPQGFNQGAWVGWSYGHDLDDDLIDWTEEMIEQDCERAIDQLLSFNKSKEPR